MLLNGPTTLGGTGSPGFGDAKTDTESAEVDLLARAGQIADHIGQERRCARSIADRVPA